MNIYYIANARIPTEKAHGINIMAMCGAFAMRGAQVELIVPKRNNPITTDAFPYYHLPENFKITYVDIPDTIGKGRLGYWKTQRAFTTALKKRAGTMKDGVVFTRDEVSAYVLAKKGCAVFYDMHGFPEEWKWAWKRSMKAVKGIVCTNEWKVTQCKEQFGIAAQKLVVARNGYHHNLFTQEFPDQQAIRKELGLVSEKDAQIVMYTGHLYPWKGAHILLKAAAQNPAVQHYFVGGTEKEIRDVQQGQDVPDNVVFLGQQPHHMIPKFIAAADVLVLPNAVNIENKRLSIYSKYDTSPIKLFEYMASKRPIVASALPSIQEVLSDSNATLVASDSPEALAAGIGTVLEQKDAMQKKAEQAYLDVQQFTWENRATIILSFIKKLTSLT